MILRIFFATLILKLSLFSCADYWNPNSIKYMFLEKKDNLFLKFSEDLNDPSIYNEIIYLYEQESKKENIKEWKKELNDVYTAEEIEDFIYNKNLTNLKDLEAKDYINFVYQQENCTTANFEESKPSRCTNFIPKALKKLEEAKTDFYKQRYFFLALRLAHYHKKNPLEIYKKYYYLVQNSNSIVKDWIDALYAGALIKKGEIAKGVYQFSKLFDEAINSHLALYNFFYIRDQKNFDSLLNLAQNSDEKAKFYTLRALDSSSNAIEEMKNIYNLDKNSKWLQFLLYRELLKSQTFFNEDIYFENNFEEDTIFYTKYIDFLNSLEIENRYLVDLSLVYFNLYTKKFEEANNILNKLLKDYPNSHEVQTVAYLLYLQSLEKIDSQTENIIIDKIEKLIDENHTSNTIYEYTLEVLSKLYKKQGLDFNLFLAQNSSYINYTILDMKKFKTFEEFLVKPQDSKLKTYLQKKFQTLIDNDGEFAYAKISLLINNLKFKEALDTNLAILNSSLEYNPFNGLIRGNNRNGKQNDLTIKDFLEKILEIKNVLKENPNSTIDNFLYANALYNLSYYGNSSKATTSHRSVVFVHTPELQEEKLNLALKHYEIALNNSNDKELKAKITYQISKTKLALFDLKYEEYPQQGSSFWRNNTQKYFYGLNDEFYEKFLKLDGAKYFDDLEKNYKNTKYYKELLKECGDFRTYINSKK
ncbi:hypothetical protein AFAEC_0777 [Aliarcobacter faecis]|uniref:hypothetical protein n=1 Tax=Aliarcobacter faecis TaxID=1564138 RepID=UPI000479D09A|nr:hypothetical protein [Aliarcobacter faecis]QKF72954.1 hypothetical protein AFAEC_0777 [Aliarcobacter faecis]